MPIGANALGVAVAIWGSVGAPGELGVGSTSLEGEAPANLVVVLEGDVPADSRVFAVARGVIASQIGADPALAPPRADPAGEDRRVVLVAELEEESAAGREWGGRALGEADRSRPAASLGGG